MKTFQQLMSEVAEPKSGDEKRFKDKHVIDKVDHPVALDHQFTGEVDGIGKAARIADHEKGEDEKVYEAKLDPVGKADADIDNDGDVDDSDEYLHNRRKEIAKAMKAKREAYEQIVAEAYEFTESAWEEVPMMKRQLYFMAYAAEEIMEWLDSGVDPEEWFQNKMAAMHGNMRTLYGYVQGEMQMMDSEADMFEESDLDEVTRTRMTTTKPIHNDPATGQEKIRESLEEAPRRKGAPKMTGDSIAIQRAKDRAHNAAMGRTATGRKKPQRAMTSTQRSLASLRKEENEQLLDEALKAGIVKLNDGSSVILKKQDADLMNKMLKDLRPNNRKSMMKTAMMDKAGFEEILGFAREAL